MTFQNILALLLLAIVSVNLSTIGRYFGRNTYYFVSSFFIGIGVVYMLYIVMTNQSPGWNDLTSLISYLFFAGIGIILGLFVEITIYVMRKNKG